MNREIMSNPESDSAKRGSRVIKRLGEFATGLNAASKATYKLSKWAGATAEIIIIGKEVYNPESDSAKRGSRVIKRLGEFATGLSDTGELLGKASDFTETTSEAIRLGIAIYKAFSGKNPK